MSYNLNTTIGAVHYGAKRTASVIRYIVLHYTANTGMDATAKGNANYFHKTDRSASAHFVVDEGEVIYQCVPVLVVAWAVGDPGKGRLKGIVTNTNSISIEMVSHSKPNGTFYIPDVTIARALELVRALQKMYGIDNDHVVRHYDVTGKLCPATHCKTIEGEAAWKQLKEQLAGTASVKEDDEMVEIRNMKILGTSFSDNGIYKNNANFISPKIFSKAGFVVSTDTDGVTPIISMPKANVNIEGKDVPLPLVNCGGNTIVDLRDFAEALGKVVSYENNQVTIK